MSAREALENLVEAVRAEAERTPMSKRTMSVSMALRLADGELAGQASGSTRSATLVSRIRRAAHDERNDRREATELQALALELCEEHEIVVAQALGLEEIVHEATKGGAA